MSVLIKNMEMPENCAKCKLWSICELLNEFNDYESLCNAVEENFTIPEDCPLVEVPVI